MRCIAIRVGVSRARDTQGDTDLYIDYIAECAGFDLIADFLHR